MTGRPLFLCGPWGHETKEDHMKPNHINKNESVAEGLTPLPKLSVRDAAAYLGLSKSFLDKRRLDGGGPIFLKMGRRVAYDTADLELWAVSTKRRNTSQVD
jgi:predicted DNA-binding transcriptional regulator AlpA